jgi:carboxylesterase type B
VPDHPASIYAQGKQNDVPLLVGWNADEGSSLRAAGYFRWSGRIL